MPMHCTHLAVCYLSHSPVLSCRYGELVRVLGLGGVVTFDYSQDPRKARLVGCDEDYVNFEGGCRVQQSGKAVGFSSRAGLTSST